MSVPTLTPLALRLALSGINAGLETAKSGQTDAGLRLIEHAAEYLASFIPTTEDKRKCQHIA